MKFITIGVFFGVLGLALAGSSTYDPNTICEGNNILYVNQCLVIGQSVTSCNGLWTIRITLTGDIEITYNPANNSFVFFTNKTKAKEIKLCVDENGHIQVLADGEAIVKATESVNDVRGELCAIRDDGIVECRNVNGNITEVKDFTKTVL